MTRYIEITAVIIVATMLIVLGIGFTKAYFTGFNDSGFFIVIETIMPQYILDYISELDGVNEASVDEAGNTIIVLNSTLVNTPEAITGIEKYVAQLEWKLKDNQANVMLYPDAIEGQFFPPPICMRNVIQNASGFFAGNVSGLYLVNNQPFVLPNDPRC